MIAIRAEVGEQLLDMLLEGWFRDLPHGLMQDVREVGVERKVEMLREVFQQALPAEHASVATLFARLLDAQDDRKAILHEAWVLAEAPDVRSLGQSLLAGETRRRRITTRTLSELDRTLASLLLELTLLFARASEARTPPPPA
ncbi:MAG: hypothetical protein ACREFY_04170 [Acetobacteraceae bacterium]